ncbi:MAG TPA: hypothetical protein VNZ44_15620 [Pyrinomonadaceae bacterium]|nr:hypothetical protein [Pyrinomonadaceae bacterium]
MRKHILVALAFAVFATLCCRNASAQLPGGLKIPKAGKPKPTPTPAEPAQPAPSGETRPAARPQPSAPAAGGATAQPQAGAEQGGIAVLKNSVWVTPRTVTSYKGDGGTYSWTPVIKFDTNGDIPSGAHYHATVSLPGGAAWAEMDCKWVGGSQSGYYQCGGPDFPEDKGTTATGLFPFAIKMRDGLQGTDQTLFTGKVKIEKAPGDEGTPAERAKKSFYYPAHDWALPVGYVYYAPEENYLYTAFWVRGSAYNVKPHIFHKGRELDYGGTDKASCNDRTEVGDGYIRSVKPAPVWHLVECKLFTVIARDKGNTDDTRQRVMSNPGEYEIKVLWNNELARSVKFGVGPDGNFSGGVLLLYKVRGDGERLSGVIVPVTVIGTQDGPWDRSAWKTEAFYGNPPQGFAPAP